MKEYFIHVAEIKCEAFSNEHQFVSNGPWLCVARQCLHLYPIFTNFSFVDEHVDELSSARIWQHILCATYSANVNMNDLLQSKNTTVFVPLDISESK